MWTGEACITLMNARQFERNAHPVTVTIGHRQFTATDWSPNGFRLPIGFARGDNEKWYPVKLSIPGPEGNIDVCGECQIRWSSGKQSGFILRTSDASHHTDLPSMRPGKRVPAVTPLIRSSELPSSRGFRRSQDASLPNDEPPVLTQIVRAGYANRTQKEKRPGRQNGRSHPRPVETSKPKLKLIAGGSQTKPLSAYSRVWLQNIPLLSSVDGTVESIHKTTGDWATKGMPLATITSNDQYALKNELLKTQQEERASLSRVQRDIINWERKVTHIDSDDGVDMDQSREAMSQALTVLNRAHEYQKLCKAPLTHYQRANIRYRKIWKQHQTALSQAELSAIEQSENRLRDIRQRLNTLHQEHEQLTSSLRALAQKISACEQASSTAIRSSVDGVVRELTASPGQAIEKNQKILTVESRETMLAELLLSREQAKYVTSGDKLQVLISNVAMTLNSTVVEVTRTPGGERLAKLDFDGQTSESPVLLRLELKAKPEQIEKLRTIDNPKLLIVTLPSRSRDSSVGGHPDSKPEPHREQL